MNDVSVWLYENMGNGEVPFKYIYIVVVVITQEVG